MTINETHHLHASPTAVMAAADASAIDTVAAPVSQQPGQTVLLDRHQSFADGRFRRTGLAIAVTVAIAWILAACSAGFPGTHASPTAQPSRPRGTMAWMLTRSALSQLVADPRARDVLHASRIYEILQPGQQPLPGVSAEPVVTFASAAAIKQAIAGAQIPANCYGVLYDPEAWSFTPPAEQSDPVAAAAEAAAEAHAHGLRFIVAPALNLTTVLAPGGMPRWQAFLRLGLAGRMAQVADVIDFQAQSLERNVATYTAFVEAAASQASRANPRVTVLAGLSTNPPGAVVTSQQLISAMQATRSLVAGYWLNIPGQGPRCPTCNPPRPDIGIQLLRQLG
jgi:hypothetical protein